MMQTKHIAAAALYLSALTCLHADVTGADPRFTGAPGDNAGACTSCHIGTKLNGGAGSVAILLPGDATYTPGVKQHITVKVSDPSQRRWGFEFTARLASNLSNGQAGDITSTDGNTQVVCNNGRGKPCSSSALVQFITHTLTGTRLGTTGSQTFEFDWTPPSTDVGHVTLYAAGNAANGDNQTTGDHIYTTSVDLAPASASPSTGPTPTLNGDNAVVNAASFETGIAQNSWVTITGTNLAGTTRSWTSQELAGGNLPTSLSNVSVTIDGKPAYVAYISPTQINVLAPADTALGPVEVKVTNNGQTSSAVMANLQAFSPAFFTFDGKYLAATHADNSLVGKAGLFASAPNLTTAAKPGETIVLYGTGFGSTSPATPSGQLTTAAANIAAPFTITIGGSPATVTFGGVVPPFAELYQFNVVVPPGVGNGDQAVAAQIGGVNSPEGSSCCFITVQR